MCLLWHLESKVVFLDFLPGPETEPNTHFPPLASLPQVYLTLTLRNDGKWAYASWPLQNDVAFLLFALGRKMKVFVVVISSELLPLLTATPSWLLTEELLLHAVLLGLELCLWVLLPISREAQTFFLHMSCNSSIYFFEKCLACIYWCV